MVGYFMEHWFSLQIEGVHFKMKIKSIVQTQDHSHLLCTMHALLDVL
jgi:hypothetical protein